MSFFAVFFERQWPSVYAALADGKIAVDQLQSLCVCGLLEEIPADALAWLAVDATPEERPEAHTSEDRGSIHVSNVPLADTPISSGWMFSVVGLLPEQASRWVPPLDIPRIRSEQTADTRGRLTDRRDRRPSNADAQALEDLAQRRNALRGQSRQELAHGGMGGEPVSPNEPQERLPTGGKALHTALQGRHPTHGVPDAHRQNVDGLDGSHPPTNQVPLFEQRLTRSLLTHALTHDDLGDPFRDGVVRRSDPWTCDRPMGSALQSDTPPLATGCGAILRNGCVVCVCHVPGTLLFTVPISLRIPWDDS